VAKLLYAKSERTQVTLPKTTKPDEFARMEAHAIVQVWSLKPEAPGLLYTPVAQTQTTKPYLTQCINQVILESQPPHKKVTPPPKTSTHRFI